MDTALEPRSRVPSHRQDAGIRGATARWVEAGLLTPEQAGRLVDFEHARHPSRSPVVAEVLAYLGAALVTAAVVTLAAQRWSEFGIGFQLGLLSVAALVGLGGGAVARSRHRPEFDRVTTVLWLASLAAVGGLVAVATGPEGVAWSDDARGAAVAVVVAAAAVVLYGLHRTALQLAAVIGSTTLAAALVLQLAVAESTVVHGTLLLLLGAAWILQSLRPVLGPAPVAFVGGGVIAYAGTSMLADQWVYLGLGLGVAGAIALVLLSLRTRDLIHLFTGAVGLFVTLPRFAVEVFGESVGAPLALLVVGLVVIGVAVMAGRLHRHDGRPPGPAHAGA